MPPGGGSALIGAGEETALGRQVPAAKLTEPAAERFPVAIWYLVPEPMACPDHVSCGGVPATTSRFCTSVGVPKAVASRGAQSPASKAPSLSSSVSMQSFAPSESVSGKPSSTCVSQLLSLPSHDSAAGKTAPWHMMDPLVHVMAPMRHSPTVDTPQMAPPPGFPSSICELQLLSTLSQA